MATNLIVLIVYIVSFAVSFFALTAVRFDRFCHLQQPWKIHLFIFLLAMAIGWLSAQFILALSIYNGIML